MRGSIAGLLFMAGMRRSEVSALRLGNPDGLLQFHTKTAFR